MSEYWHIAFFKLYTHKTSMKKIKTLLLFALLTTISTLSAQTLSWNALQHANDPEDDSMLMYLEKYGLYQNGKEVNTFYPSDQNHNKGEYVSLTLNPKNNTFKMDWYKTADGEQKYTGTYSGAVLNIKENNNKFRLLSWTKISNGKYRAKTVDSFNTYRYYIVEPWNVSEALYDLFDMLF